MLRIYWFVFLVEFYAACVVVIGSSCCCVGSNKSKEMSSEGACHLAFHRWSRYRGTGSLTPGVSDVFCACKSMKYCALCVPSK